MNGSVKIKIEGLNSSKVVNALVDRGTFLKNLKRKSKFVLFEIQQSDEKELIEICKKFHKRYEVISKNNLVNTLKKTKYYFGFVFALLLVFAYIFSFNLYVFNVNLSVASNQEFDLTLVEKILHENGVTSGTKKSDLDLKSLQMLISSREDIAGCNVKFNGGNLEVVIYPAVLKEEVFKGDVFSKVDAVVTKVEIFSGKTSVKVGDFVKKNDLLIENDNGASGKILGKVYFSDYIIYNENQITKEFTGRFVEDLIYSVFNKNINKPKKNIEFSNYLEENCVFYVSKYNFLPIKVNRVRYLEFNYKEEVIEFFKVENELKEKLYNDVFGKIEEKYKDKITNVTYSVVTEENLTRLDCFIECEIDLVSL